MFQPNLKSVAIPVREIIAIGVLGFWVGVRTPNLGKEEAVGVGMVRSKDRWRVPIGPA